MSGVKVPRPAGQPDATPTSAASCTPERRRGAACAGTTTPGKAGPSLRRVLFSDPLSANAPGSATAACSNAAAEELRSAVVQMAAELAAECPSRGPVEWRKEEDAVYAIV